MIGYASDVDAVNDVVQDIDKLHQRHRDREIMIFLTILPLEKSFCVLEALIQTPFFLRLDTI